MIGITNKMTFLRALALSLVSVWLAACQQLSPKPTPSEPAAPAAAPAPTTAPPDQAQTPTGAASAAPAADVLTAPLLYDVLLGEIAGQRGRLDISGASYLDAARRSRDPRIAERALKIAVFAKQPALALEAARRWVVLDPESLEARQSLAVLALRTQHTQEALEQFQYLLTHANEDTDPYQALLGLLAREPDSARALEVMKALADLRPDDPEAHFTYSRLAVHAQQWELAQREVARALELRPDWVPALILQAQIDLKQGRKERARSGLEGALQRHPEDTDLRLAYARLLVDLDDFGAARAQYRKLLKAQPENGQVVYSLGLLSLEAGELDEARKLFQQLVTMEYQIQQAYYYLGAIAEEQKKPEQAMQWYRKVDEGDHWLEVQIRMARLDALAGDVQEARERLRRVRLTHPGETQRMYLVEGEILSQIDWNEQAFQLYSEYLGSQPDDVEILYARALVAERLDRLQQAEKDFRHVLKLEPDNARALNALGYTLADRTDRYQEALGYVQKALAQTPDDPAVIDSMGWVLYRLGRLQEAREYLQKAYDMTKDSEIAAHLGEVMWALGDRDQAKALWGAARKADPGDRVLEDTVRRYQR